MGTVTTTVTLHNPCARPAIIILSMVDLLSTTGTGKGMDVMLDCSIDNMNLRFDDHPDGIGKR